VLVDFLQISTRDSSRLAG